MKNKKPRKTLIWKYSTVKIFISVIVFLIFICFIGAQYSYSKDNDFAYSALLNVFGGLFTGLILLSYQYLSKKHLKEANNIVERLELLKEIPIFFAEELDFCTDTNRPLEEQIGDNEAIVSLILKDNEGLSYALGKYKEEIRKSEKQLNIIIEFLNNVLRIPLNYSIYNKKLIETKQYFSIYSEEIEYVMPPYFLRERSKLEDSQLEYSDDVIEGSDTEETLNTYLERNSDILNNGQYWGNTYEKRVVYNNHTEVLIEDVYNDWIHKMNELAKNTKEFNEVFMENKEKIFGIHNKNSNIIH